MFLRIKSRPFWINRPGPFGTQAAPLKKNYVTCPLQREDLALLPGIGPLLKKHSGVSRLFHSDFFAVWFGYGVCCLFFLRSGPFYLPGAPPFFYRKRNSFCGQSARSIVLRHYSSSMFFKSYPRHFSHGLPACQSSATAREQRNGLRHVL